MATMGEVKFDPSDSSAWIWDGTRWLRLQSPPNLATTTTVQGIQWTQPAKVPWELRLEPDPPTDEEIAEAIESIRRAARD